MVRLSRRFLRCLKRPICVVYGASQFKATKEDEMDGQVSKLNGSCHCGTVRFQVEMNLADGGSRCNCSICQKVGGVNTILKPAAFTLLSGEGNMTEYQW